jgi:magnesium transporter
MAPNQNHLSYRFSDTLKRLLRRNAIPNIKKILARTQPVDLALSLDAFMPQERLKLLSYVGDDSRQAEVVACMPVAKSIDLLQEVSLERAAQLLSNMSGDDRTDILGALDEDFAAKILVAMPDEESDETTELLRYGENTAGGIMSPDFLTIPEEVSASEAIGIVQDSPDVEMVFYIYAVSSHGALVGVVSLRQLVTFRGDVRLRDIMNPHVVSVQTDEDQEDVARIVSRYDFLAVPVVDNTNHIVGVVTVDDVIDVIREEATEDILKMAGAGDEWDDNQSVMSSVKQRVPWLAAAWMGGIVASFIIAYFESTVARILPLVAFIPIIIGMAGNVGTQSLTVVVRGLATKKIDIKKFWSVTWREGLTGILLGLFYGAALGALGFVQLMGTPEYNALMVATVVGSASAITMIMAAFVGAMMPLLLGKLQIDPAVATGPFVTTTIDILGVLVYFNMARLLI